VKVEFQFGIKIYLNLFISFRKIIFAVNWNKIVITEIVIIMIIIIIMVMILI